MQSGGTAIGATVLNGGTQFVLSGGIASGTVINGGTLEVEQGGSTGTGAVTFAGRGTLLLDDSVHFTGLVAGFGGLEQIDLADIDFNEGLTGVGFNQLSPTSGTLRVSDGIHTADITLLGQYTAADFQLQSDGHGGTLVTDSQFSRETTSNSLILANPNHM